LNKARPADERRRAIGERDEFCIGTVELLYSYDPGVYDSVTDHRGRQLVQLLE
jgi:hypothetical protein